MPYGDTITCASVFSRSSVKLGRQGTSTCAGPRNQGAALPAHLLPRLKSPSRSLLRNISLDFPHHEKQKNCKIRTLWETILLPPCATGHSFQGGEGRWTEARVQDLKVSGFLWESNHTRTGIFFKNTPHTNRRLNHRRREKSGRDKTDKTAQPSLAAAAVTEVPGV